MAIVKGWVLGAELCKALGIDPSNVLEVQLRSRSRTPGVLIVERAILADEIPAITRVLEHYKVEKEGESDL